MYMRKCPHPSNFEYVRTTDRAGRARLGRTVVRARFDRFDGDLFRLRVGSATWGPNLSQAGLTPPRRTSKGCVRAELDPSLALTLTDASGQVLLRAPRGAAVGVSGAASIFQFEHREGDQFYGMGEKLLGLELSGKLTKFWNTDVFGDFHWREVFNDRPDPLYASIPYLIIKRGNTYVGLLLDNPHATFISTAANVEIGGGQLNLGRPTKKAIYLGAEQGASDLYILVGPTLPELTRKLQHLVGLTPLPPVWAIGYQQCRWGYRSEADLMELDRRFRQHRIPCDGLWLDIDYMDRFMVFTFHKEHFPDLRRSLAELERRGRKVIPILDPGVKRLPGYAVYDDGRARGAFCRNPQGGEFIGLVWPGETVFPDFSLPSARAWWARWVKKFARNGIRGAWIDMNDPSTGAVQNDAMRFGRGRKPHDAFHNQYASGMAVATRAGFEAAHPGERVFVISRSGHTGISRHAALWTGDNCSNYHYLRLAIPCSLNLALSGVPFNGPDIGGFAGSCPANLLRDWQKACFLFPFCRNHTAGGERRQEPWAYDAGTLKVCAHYIRLRYKLRPYLYNLFIRQAEAGDAILRPLFHDFTDTAEWPLGTVDDQFLVGPAVLQAPILDEKQRSRSVLLPGDTRWWSVMDAKWIRAPRRIRVAPGPMQTPLFVREGQIVPMAPGEPTRAAYDGARVDAHVFLRRGRGSAAFDYAWDDGHTLAYRKGARSIVTLSAATRGDAIRIETRTVQSGCGNPRVRFVLYDRFRRITWNGKPVQAVRAPWMFCGSSQPVWMVESRG